MKRALKVCPHPGCPELVRPPNRYCEAHARQYKKKYDPRPSSAERGYDADWRAFRARFLAEYPYCARCGRPATQVHHIVPLSAGGERLDWANCESLCHSCHSRHTARHDGGFGHGRK